MSGDLLTCKGDSVVISSYVRKIIRKEVFIMAYSIHIEKSVPIVVRDGALLRADIYRPGDKEKHPALLVRTPYNREMSFNSPFFPYYNAVEAGYSVIIQSLRGVFDSDGRDGLQPLMFEGPDGYDTVEWLAHQSWCDGNIGTCGASYSGGIQWITACENPPHLKAMAPWVTGQGWDEPTRLNGILNLGIAVNWLLTMTVENINRQEKMGKDVSSIRDLLLKAVADPSQVYNYLPLKDVPHFNFDQIKEMWVSRILNSDRDTPEYVEKTRLPFKKIMAPCFHVSGWFDFYPSGTLGHFNNMREKGGSELAKKNQSVMIGPWLHGGPTASGDTGALGFGTSASILGSQIGEFHLAFFNKYLKGMKVDLPAVRYFVMGRNVWKTADAWPLPETHWQRFFLHSRGHANSAAGDGLLDRNEPKAELPDNYIYNPHFPVPTNGCRGQQILMVFAPSPQEQTLIERRGDVLCYTTPELEKDIEVTGPLALHLFAASSARDTDFTAKLVDVYPNGYAYNVVCDGITRARYRKSIFKPELLIPGGINEYVINMQATSQLFQKGHRIRIDITSSSFPEYDRNMNTGNAIGEDERGIPALQTIYHQSDYASYIDLPVIRPAN
jgi:putative CocE/NonD family hydrolase